MLRKIELSVQWRIIFPVHENGVNGTSVMSANESGYTLWELLENGVVSEIKIK